MCEKHKTRNYILNSRTASVPHSSQGTQYALSKISVTTMGKIGLYTIPPALMPEKKCQVPRQTYFRNALKVPYLSCAYKNYSLPCMSNVQNDTEPTQL